MPFTPIQVQTPAFNAFWNIYEEAFPSDERREKKQQEAVMKRKEYQLLGYYAQKKMVGFMASWTFPEFIIFEHLAIEAPLRNKGLGSAMIREYLQNEPRRVVVEVEKPETSVNAARRIRFYDRLKFKVSPYRYTQPPYSATKNPVSMKMITNKAMTPEEYDNIRAKIHKELYGLAKPLLD
jgi:ribosomal protein S18 acetylase RimI-like enzyme